MGSILQTVQNDMLVILDENSKPRHQSPVSNALQVPQPQARRRRSVGNIARDLGAGIE
jgi:hypothetical protein